MMTRDRLSSVNEQEMKDAVRVLTRDNSISYVADMILLEDPKLLQFLETYQKENPKDIPAFYKEVKSAFAHNSNQENKKPGNRSYSNSYYSILFAEKNHNKLKSFANSFVESVGKKFENNPENKEWEETLRKIEHISFNKSSMSKS
jgi:hypothetical protein